MRFVERQAAHVAALLACLALFGCASSPKPKADERAPVAASAAPASAPASAPEPAKPVEPEVVVTPAAQRAFDDARRVMRAGRTADAERAFLALTKSDPDLGGPHANLGVIYRDSNRLEPAIAELETAVKLSPRQPAFFNELGVTYRQAGQFDKARQAYEQAVALDPNGAAAVLNLGILFDLYLADGARALPLYERYLALSPQGDAAVGKWVADLKNRKPAAAKKEKE